MHLGFVLLFCNLVCLMFVFQWRGLGELVSIMEQIPSCFVDGLYSECESRFLVMIGAVVFREWEDKVKEELYEAH
jgi:hypothetical protein